MSERVEVLEIDLTDIQQEAEETGQTLRDLRAEVKELRSALEGTEIGTEEFGKALTDLTKKQQELTNVTKSGIAAQKGSYNDLVNQMALLKMQWRATADEGERAALGSQIDEINTKLKEMDASVGNYQRNVGNYRQELKQLKEDLLSLEEGTEEYSAALARAAEISQKMQDVNEFVAQSAQDMGDHLQNVTGVAAGMVGAFQTVQASLNLIGVESESIGKMMATMQNLMAITQGLTAIEGAVDKYKRLNETIKGLTIVQKLFGTAKAKTTAATTADTAATVANTTATVAQTAATGAATKAQWSFNAAIAANPLGAILIAITAVVTALVSLVSWLGTAGDTAEGAAAKNDALTDSLSRQNKAIDQNIQLWQAQGMTRKEALQKSLSDQEEVVQQALDNYIEIRDAADNSERWFGLVSPRSDEEREEIDQAWEIYLQEKERLADREFEIVIENEREITEARKKEEEAQIQYARTAAQQRTQLLKQEAERRKKIIEDAWKDILEIEKDFNERIADIQFEASLVGMNEEEAAIARSRKEYTDMDNELVREINKIEDALWTLYREGEITLQDYNDRINDIRSKSLGISLNRFTLMQQDEEKIHREYMEKRIKRVEDFLSEETAIYKKYRDRTLRTIALTEEAINQVYERTPEGSTGKEWVRAEEAKLTALKKLYTEQLKVLEAQDNAERDTVQMAIDATQARIRALREFVNDENNLPVDIARATEELRLLEDSLMDMTDQYSQIGAETIAITEALNTVVNDLSHIEIKMTIANLEGIRDGFSELKETFSELNDIGDAFSDEWSRVFDTIITGIDTACTSLREMDSVIKSNATETEKAAAKWKGYGQMAAAGLAVAASMMGALADEQDKTTKDGFERSKNFQIAQAVMSTLSGVASAWASSMQLGPIAGPIMGAILSAMMLTMGGIQIANIKKQKFDGSGNLDSGSTPIPSLSALNAMGTPVAATTNIEGASTEGVTTDTRVYVLESDISNSQNNVKTTVAEATF